MEARRGFVPQDARDFSPQAAGTLRAASRQVRFLLDEGYAPKQAVTFVGNHYLLSERQRLAVMRSAASREQCRQRESRRLADLAGAVAMVDGFNEIITLEVLLCRSPLFRCMDGTIRDLASLRGTYRLIPETAGAVQMMLSALARAGAAGACILLDAPVSNSGRLKAAIAETAEQSAEEPLRSHLDIRVCSDVDRTLYGARNVITSDSVILDRCGSWFNLTETCLAGTDAQVLQVWEAPGPGPV